MESKASSGQILIECALALLVFAILLSNLLDFDGRKKTGYEKKKIKQNIDFSNYRNEK